MPKPFGVTEIPPIEESNAKEDYDECGNKDSMKKPSMDDTFEENNKKRDDYLNKNFICSWKLDLKKRFIYLLTISLLPK